MADPPMKQFWDERAREDAYFFVENRLQYGRPDEDRFWREGDEIVDAVLAQVDGAVRPEDDVVEIGCGPGRLTRALAGRARSVVGLDVSEEMIALARAHNAGLSNVRWLVGDGVSLAGVDDASVDLVFSHVVFQHVPDPAITYGYVREMGRVLRRPAGRAVFHVSNDPSVHRPRSVGLGGRLRAAVGRGPRGQDHPAWLGSAVDLSSLRAAAGEAGLSVDRVAGAGTQFCFVALSADSQ